MKKLPDQNYLNSCLIYNPETGEIRWKERPLNHFKREASGRSWNTKYSGNVAGVIFTSPGGKKYRIITIKYSRYFAHRLAWLMIYGESPDTIDHIDGNGLNNILANLRNVTHSINQKNMKLKSNNTSGTSGVYFYKRTKQWVSRIKVNYKYIWLGSFIEKEDAIACRKEAEIKYGFHKNHGSIRDL